MKEELMISFYDEMLDETNQEIKIGSLTYSPSQVLKAVDPIAYDIGLSEYFSFLIEEDEKAFP